MTFIVSACTSEKEEVASDVTQDKHELETKESTPSERFPVDTSWKKDYVLDIKGESPFLSKDVVASMGQWRKEIVEFSKLQEQLFMNGPNEKKVALTFDDGPDETVTPAIINVLDEYKIKGSFFFVGSEAEKQPDVVKQAYEKGHLVLNHSYSHAELTRLDKTEIEAEIDKTSNFLKTIIGKEPAIVRSPYGSTNDQVMEVAKDGGYSIVLWSIDSLDWAQRSPEVIFENVTTNIRNGDIILMHSDSDEYDTYEILPEIIEALQEKGFEIVDLETLLGVKAYK